MKTLLILLLLSLVSCKPARYEIVETEFSYAVHDTLADRNYPFFISGDNQHMLISARITDACSMKDYDYVEIAGAVE